MLALFAVGDVYASLCKKGLGTIVGGAVAGTVSPEVGLAVTLSCGLLQYRGARRKDLETRWTSWAFMQPGLFGNAYALCH